MRHGDRLGALASVELGEVVVVVARRRSERRRGLAGLGELPAGTGLQIVPCSSVHTLGMRFALDLVWLDRDGEVLRVDLDVAPRRMRTCIRARSVIEVTAGDGERFARAVSDAGGLRR